MFAARITAKLAGSIRIAEIPGTLKLVSSVLDAGNQPASQQDSLLHHADYNASRNESAPGWNSSVRIYWQRVKAEWAVPEEPTLTDKDSLFPVLGTVILKELACDLDNCVEMLEAKILISKIIGLISNTANIYYDNYEPQNTIISSSLRLVKRLASADGKIGASVR